MSVHRSGFVSILGRPNVGKSTLLNALVEHKVSIVTPRPQTTRNRILAIYDTENCQIIFQDTPGLLAPRDAMHRFMVDEVRRAIENTDVILLLVDAKKGVGHRERRLCELLTPSSAECGMRNAERGVRSAECGMRNAERGVRSAECGMRNAERRPELVEGCGVRSGVLSLSKGAERATGPTRADRPAVFVVLNKMDLIHPSKVEERIRNAQSLSFSPPATVLTLSALYGTGLGDVLAAVKESLPEGPKYYDPNILTDRTERFMVEELIREQSFLRVRDEIPHAIAVQVEEMLDAPERKKVSITALVIVERDTQRAILIGKGGSMIKAIGQEARKEIEVLLGRPVFLSLRVKVMKQWRKGEPILRRLGYHRR